MMRISIMFIAALAAAGCKKSGGGGDCEQAIAHSMEVAKASMPKDNQMVGKMRDLAVQHCKADKWSDEAIKCMLDAKAESDAQTCYGKLSADQQKKMNEDAMKLATSTAEAAAGSAGSAAPAAAAAPAAGSAGSADGAAAPAAPAAGSAGSADGSAAAGSAAGGGW